MGAFAENVPRLTSESGTDSGEDTNDGEFAQIFRVQTYNILVYNYCISDENDTWEVDNISDKEDENEELETDKGDHEMIDHEDVDAGFLVNAVAVSLALCLTL